MKTNILSAGLMAYPFVDALKGDDIMLKIAAGAAMVGPLVGLLSSGKCEAPSDGANQNKGFSLGSLLNVFGNTNVLETACVAGAAYVAYRYYTTPSPNGKMIALMAGASALLALLDAVKAPGNLPFTAC